MNRPDTDDWADAGRFDSKRVDYDGGTRLVHLSAGSYNMPLHGLVYNAGIQGAGAAETVIKGTIRGLRTGALLSHLTVTNGMEGGVRIGQGEAPEISHCTITGNSAQYGAGVYFHNSTPILVNCIVWGNEGDAMYLGGDSNPQISFTCLEHDEVWTGEGNINVAPLFVETGVFDFNQLKTVTIGDEEYELPDYVVEAGNYHLMTESPAIDTTNSEEVPEFDLHGNPRPLGEGYDMGAYERAKDCNGNEIPDESEPDCNENGIPDDYDITSGASADVNGDGIPDECSGFFLRGEINMDGNRNIADVVYLLSYNFAGGAEPACHDAADSNDDGTINIADAVALLSHLFAGAGPLPEPFDICGMDETEDDLGCESFPPCN